MSTKHEKGTIHVPPSKTPREHQGAHYASGKQTTTLTDAQVEQELLASFGITPLSEATGTTETSGPSHKSVPPIFGVDRAPQIEQPRYITVGIGTWLYDSPRWDNNRIRLGRADKPTPGRILQEIEDPRDSQRPVGHRRVSIELEHSWIGQDKQRHVSRFWVNPKRGGFEGMPAKGISRPTLGLTKQAKTPQT